jgi:hypothetical protein
MPHRKNIRNFKINNSFWIENEFRCADLRINLLAVKERYRHLRQSLRFRVRHLRWVLNFLTGEQKQIRVQMAIELLQVLSVQGTRQWHDIVTLDESWIYLFSEHDLMWTAPGEIVVDREWHIAQSPRFMLTVVWNPIGFHVLTALPKGRKFNAQYYIILYK